MAIEMSKTEKEMEKRLKQKTRIEYPRNVGQLQMCNIYIYIYFRILKREERKERKKGGRVGKRKGSSL